MLPLYERIDKLCKDSGTNITQMCKEAGVQRSALSDYKSGKNKTISFANLQKIADFFKMTVDELVNGETKKSPDTEMSEDDELNELMEELKNNPGKRLLFSKTKKATKEDIEKIIAMIDILTGGNDNGYYF